MTNRNWTWCTCITHLPGPLWKLALPFTSFQLNSSKFVNGSEGWADTSPCFGARDPTGPTQPLLPSFLASGKSDLSTMKGNTNHQLMQGKVNQNVREVWYWWEWWLILIILTILLILKILMFHNALMRWCHLLDTRITMHIIAIGSELGPSLKFWWDCWSGKLEFHRYKLCQVI